MVVMRPEVWLLLASSAVGCAAPAGVSTAPTQGDLASSSTPVDAAPVAQIGEGERETRLYSAQVAHLTGDDRTFLIVGGFTADGEGQASRVPVLAATVDDLWKTMWEARWDGGGATIVRNVAIADLDGDGRDEIAALGRVGADTSSCRGELRLLGVRDGQLGELARTSFQDGVYTHGYGLAVADVDGDGHPEIVGGGFSREGDTERGDLRVWRQRGVALDLVARHHFAERGEESTRVNAVAIADVDGDGRPEILTAGRHGPHDHEGTGHEKKRKRKETGSLRAFHLDGDRLVEQAHFRWKVGATTRIRALTTLDRDGDGRHEVVVAGQCERGGQACLALLRWGERGFEVVSQPALEAAPGEVKALLVVGEGASLRVVTTGSSGKKPNRQARVELWRLDEGQLTRERRWSSHNGDETRPRAIAVWPTAEGPKLITVGHASSGAHIVGQLLDWGRGD